jgi:hypothetical protein
MTRMLWEALQLGFDAHQGPRLLAENVPVNGKLSVRVLSNGTVVNYPQFKQVVSCKIGAK